MRVNIVLFKKKNHKYFLFHFYQKNKQHWKWKQILISNEKKVDGSIGAADIHTPLNIFK